MDQLQIGGLEPLINHIVEAVSAKVVEQLSALAVPQKSLTVKQTAERFHISETSVKELFRKKDSPAFRIGDSEKSSWRVDAEDFKRYLLKNTNRE